MSKKSTDLEVSKLFTRDRRTSTSQLEVEGAGEKSKSLFMYQV